MQNNNVKNQTQAQLHERAKEIFKSTPRQHKTISYDDTYEIFEQNELYKIEINLLNDELQKILLKYEEERCRFTNLLDFIPFPCFILDQHGEIIDINEAGSNLIGVKKINLVHKNLLRYVAANFQHICIEHFQQAASQTTPQTCEIKLLQKDGPMFFAQCDTKALHNPVTQQTYLLTFIKNIDDIRQKESDIRESQKKIAFTERNNSMGEFAEIISHELNHPLAVITNYVHGCIRRLESGKFQVSDVIEALKKAGDQSHRINEIILRMKNFTCKGTMQYEAADINHLINETIALIKHENLAFPVNVHYYPMQNSPEILLDKIHIQQVIVNLARNAIESMRDAECADPKLFLEVYHVNQDQIEINVIDNGPGISVDSLHKLFNPYFTTKPYGIGLGLAVSRKIIEAHGGTLSAEKHPLGTCFKFTLLTKPLDDELIHKFAADSSLLN